MALDGHLDGLCEYGETMKRDTGAKADLRNETDCTIDGVSQILSACLGSESGLLNEMDSTWSEHTTSPPLSPFHNHCLSLCEGQSWQAISPDLTGDRETGQQYRGMHNLASLAGMTTSSSMNEFKFDSKARAVGHGRPRSVSQPLPPKDLSPPPYTGKRSSSHANDGLFKLQEFGVGNSSIPETSTSSWNRRRNPVYDRTHFRSQGSVSPDNLKTACADRIPAFQGPSCDKHLYSNAVPKDGPRNHLTIKQGTRMQNAPADYQFPLSGGPFSSSLLRYETNSNPSFPFQNGHSYAASGMQQGLGSTTDMFAVAVSDPLTQNCDELSDEVFSTLRLNQVTPEEQLRTNASQLRSKSFHQQQILGIFQKSTAPLGSLEIAKAIGSLTLSDVESLLYTLTHVGLLKVTRRQPPLWTLSQEVVRKTSVGVIGGEKKRRQSRRSANMNDFDLQDLTAWGRPEQAKSICSKRGGEQYPLFCDICKVSLTTEEQATDHFNSNKHRNKLSKFRHPTFCDYCKVNLNSESQAKEHFSSGRHEQTVAKSQKAPVKIHPFLVTVEQTFAPVCNTLTSPEGYQTELYQKAMRTNGVCFLPTGTGKNLVAALVIAQMLHLNPTRQIIFLVDRVLLVLQQSNFLRKELGHLKVQVPQVCGPSSSGARQHPFRPIRIGAVCGEMRKLDGQARIFEHDVLVITADCYRNHLSNKTLRVEDVSLIVLDEAHHCNKDHPYNVIMREHYLHENSFLLHKPKVLGLTTSAAGEPSLDRTTKKLQRLLSNLGNASMLTVTRHVKELEERTIQPELLCLRTEFTPTEKEMLDGLIEYATKCFNQAVRTSDLKNYKEIFQPSAGNFLNKEDIFPILSVVDNILLQSATDGDAHSSLLHFQIICEAICSLQECGARVALEGLRHLYNERCPHGLDWALKKGLPYDKVSCFLDQYLLQGAQYFDDFEAMDSGVHRLLEQLQEVDWHRVRVSPRPLALVLVKRPSTACCLANYLSGRQELMQRYVSVACAASSGGAILNIRDKECHVAVATSVTEEGLDLADCELVIQLDPPCSVAALSQIRSRAWKLGTRLVAVCRDDEHSRRIQELLKREEYMNMATHDIVFT